MKRGRKKGIPCSFKVRYSRDNGWSFVTGFKPGLLLTQAEGRAINRCARRRGIKGFHSVGNRTTVSGVHFV